MPGIFKVPFSYTGTGPIDLAELNAASGNSLVLLGLTIFQTGVADMGDAQEESVELALDTGNTTTGTGTDVTPVATASDGGAANFTAKHLVTVAATGGTAVERGRWGWNIRVEKEKMLTEGEQIKIGAGVRASFRLRSTAADSLTIKGELIVQEF